jgi:hypothetical protein
MLKYGGMGVGFGFSLLSYYLADTDRDKARAAFTSIGAVAGGAVGAWIGGVLASPTILGSAPAAFLMGTGMSFAGQGIAGEVFDLILPEENYNY